MLSINDIKNKIFSICEGTKVLKMILFGSYAKGVASENSDIDLYLISNGEITGFDFFDIKSKIEDMFSNVKVDLIPDLDIIPNSKIEKEIMKYGVVIYEQ